MGIGLLVKGKWVNQPYSTKKTEGKFKRASSVFRNWIGGQSFPAEAHRYHLYVSYACPWAHRTLLFRYFKQLEKLITLTVVHPHMGDKGWSFGEEVDVVNNKKKLYEIYLLADPSYSGRVTVPVLWDKKTKTIVNNESAEIIRMFNSAFNHITGNQDDYYPVHLRDDIDKTNDFVYNNINNGVYKAGFATQQNVYDKEVKAVFNALDYIENTLAKQRYLLGNTITEADWRLFTTLLRFDPVYYTHFKCNLKRIADYPQLRNYLRDLYQKKHVHKSVNMSHIKEHYYTSHPHLNPSGIIPLGPHLDYDAPHDRDRFG